MLDRLYRKFFRKQPPRLFLGAVTVPPRSGFLRYFEHSALGGATSSQLRDFVGEWLRLLEAPDKEMAQDNDLAVEVTIADYRFGQAMSGDPYLLVFWRPMVKIACRVYQVRSNKTITALSVTHRMSWSEYFKRIMSIKFLLLPSNAASKADMYQLVGEGLLKIVSRLRKKL